MDMGLRHNKTDKTDAYHLALIQRLYHHQLINFNLKLIDSLIRLVVSMTS